MKYINITTGSSFNSSSFDELIQWGTATSAEPQPEPPKPPEKNYLDVPVPEHGLGSLPNFRRMRFTDLWKGLRKPRGFYGMPYITPAGSLVLFSDDKCPVCDHTAREHDRNQKRLQELAAAPYDEDDEEQGEDVGPHNPKTVQPWVNPLVGPKDEQPHLWEPVRGALKLRRLPRSGQPESVTLFVAEAVTLFARELRGIAKAVMGDRLKDHPDLVARSTVRYEIRSDMIMYGIPMFVYGVPVFHLCMYGNCYLLDDSLVNIPDYERLVQMGFNRGILPFSWERYENGTWPDPEGGMQTLDGTEES